MIYREEMNIYSENSGVQSKPPRISLVHHITNNLLCTQVCVCKLLNFVACSQSGAMFSLCVCVSVFHSVACPRSFMFILAGRSQSAALAAALPVVSGAHKRLNTQPTTRPKTDMHANTHSVDSCAFNTCLMTRSRCSVIYVLAPLISSHKHTYEHTHCGSRLTQSA